MLYNMYMSTEARKRLLKCFMRSNLMYGCESWTIHQNMKKWIEVVEMWFLRRMLRIPNTSCVASGEVLRRARTERSIMKRIRRTPLKFVGHTIRDEGSESDCWGELNELEQEVAKE